MARNNPASRGRCGSDQAGFTLLELLVALTLLGLVLAVVFGELRFAARAWDAADAKLDRSGELIAVHSFLRQRFEQIHAVPRIRRRGEDADAAEVFSGNSRSMTFRGTLPAAVSNGGFYRISLSLEPGPDSDGLVISWHPYDEEVPAASAAGPDNSRRLLSGVREVRFAYFGHTAENTAPQWWDTWPSTDTTPSLIRVRISLNDSDPRIWPELVAAPATAALQVVTRRP